MTDICIENDEPLWDEKQAAEFLNLSPSTLQKMRLRGDGPPFIRLGGARRYRPARVRAYAEECEVRSTSAPKIAAAA